MEEETETGKAPAGSNDLGSTAGPGSGPSAGKNRTSTHTLQDGKGTPKDGASAAEAPGQELSLPFPATLSHSLFLVEPFHASDFLLSRKHMLLDDLRSELRTYLTSLRAQLVSIINSDYEDFINLGGAHLLGSEDQMAYRMRKPLEGISREIREAREELESVRSALRDKLEKRERIRQRKLTARKLLAVNEQLLKVEDMLLISSPHEASTLSPATRQAPNLDAVRRVSASQQQQSKKAAALGHMASGVGAAAGKVDRSMGSDTKRLERTAQEYNQLLYLVRKSQDHRFVKSLQPRIDRISATLQQDLSSLLSSTLTSFHTGSSTQSMAAAQRARTEALTDLFRTYASMSQFRLAEEVIRRNLVSDFVVRTIHREALLAPQSPMMPVTPFAGFGSLGSMLAVTPTLASPSSGAGGGSFPFSFAQQQQQQSAKSSTGSTAGSAEDKSAIPPFYQIDLVHASPSAAATDTFISDALVDMYNKLLIFISKELGVVLEITERKPAQGTGHAGPAAREPTMSSSTILGQDGDATVPGSPATRERLLSDRNGSKPGYEILSNVVWAEIAQRLMGECGHLIFSAGRPETFHRNYTATQAFIGRLENLCPSQKYLQILRNSPQYTAFMKRWQLPVYYQLRFKEIVGVLESVLATTIIYQAPSTVQSTPLLLAASESVYTAIGSCWKDDIYLSDLAGRFWRLTLQLLSRYRTWVNASLPDAVRQQLGSAQSVLAGNQLAGYPASSAPSAALQRTASGVSLQRLLPSALSAAAGAGSRPGTPQPASSSSPASDEQSDEDALRKLSIIIHDAVKLRELVDRLFQDVITPKLPKLGGGSLRPGDGDESTPDATMSASLASITALAPPLLLQLVGILSKRCSEPLRLVRSGASQVRAAPRSAKAPALPEPSYFVPNILRPARAFLDGAGKVLPGGERQVLMQALLEDLANKYEAALSKMKKDGDALRRLKKGRQGTGFSSLFGRGTASAAASADDAAGPNAEDERVKEQMSVDIEAFAKEAESLGADLSAGESLAALRAVVADWTK